jgi:anti-sigma-K factor RskA
MDQFRELIEAYALGALDPEERASVAAHLAGGCAECSQALDEARRLVGQLAYLAPEAQPSDALRSRLLETVRAEATAAHAARSSGSVPFWMWGAVAALLVFAIYLTREVSRLKGAVERTIEQRRELEEEFAVAREALIIKDEHSVRIPMATGDKHMPKLEAMWHAKFGIVVAGRNVPAPPGTRTLQLWLIPRAQNGKPIPSLMLRPDAGGKFMLLVTNPPGTMEATKALAITEEPAGGSAQPTTKPIWVGTIG